MFGALRSGWSAAMRSSIGRPAIYGGLAGAGWGMMSSDSSVIGGAMIGAVTGAGLGAGARYSAIGGMVFRDRMSRGMTAEAARVEGFNAIGRIFKRDMARGYNGAVMVANRGYNRIRSSMKGWGAGLGAGI